MHEPMRDLDIEQFTNLLAFGRETPPYWNSIDKIHELLDLLEQIDEAGQDRIVDENFDQVTAHSVTEDQSEAISNILADVLYHWSQMAYAFDKNSKALMM